MDEIVVSPLEHAGFRVCWGRERGVFELRSIVTDRRLSTTGTLWTAEHVVAELSEWGFWIDPEVIEPLLVADELVRVTIGDPFVVGDPSLGVVGLATPDGRRVEPLVVPHGGLGWVDTTPDQLAMTAARVLRAATPMTFPGHVDRDLPRRAASAFLVAVAGGRPELGLNVRAVQRWALAVMDPTGSFAPVVVDDLLAAASRVDPEALDQGVRTLRRSTPTGRPGVGRPVRRRARGLHRH